MEKIDVEINTGNAIKLFINQYGRPHQVFKELVKNSTQADASEITVEVDKRKKYIQIHDNGHGMDGENSDMNDRLTLRRVPKRIADSVKDNCFGIGMLGFAKLGSDMIIRTKTDRSKTYILKMNEKEITDKDRPICGMDEAKEFGFENREYKGTDVIIRKLKKRAVPVFDNLYKFLRDEFNPYLRNGGVITLIYDGHEAQIKPNIYVGYPIHIPEEIGETPYGTVKFEIYTVLNEEPKVSVYTGADRIKEKIEAIEEFKKEPWTSKKICGEIRCDFLKSCITTDRSDYDEADERFHEFVKSVNKAGDIIKPLIKKEEDERKKEADKSILEELRNIINSNEFLELFDELNLDAPYTTGLKRGINKEHKKPELGKINIYGCVTDINTGEPVRSAEIRCNNKNNTNAIRSTDASGYYLFENIDTGTYNITAFNEEYHQKKRRKEYLKEGEYQEDFKLLPINEPIKPRIPHRTGFNPEFTDDPDIFEYPYYNELRSIYKEKPMSIIYIRERFYNDYRNGLESKFSGVKNWSAIVDGKLFKYCYELIIKEIILLNKGLHYDSEREAYITEAELLERINRLRSEIEDFSHPST